MNERLIYIVEEATATNSISKISGDEREALVEIYRKATGEDVDPYCDSCIFKIANYINNHKILSNVRKNKKRG